MKRVGSVGAGGEEDRLCVTGLMREEGVDDERFLRSKEAGRGSAWWSDSGRRERGSTGRWTGWLDSFFSWEEAENGTETEESGERD